VICTDCGRTTPEDAQFCPGCGRRLVTRASVEAPWTLLEGERRVVTILMSDLSGFTAMGERLDPEAVADIMRTIKQDGTAIVEAHGGLVNQFVGDEIVSLFGLPTARDDDARRAVAAALALHERVEGLNDEVVARSGARLAMHSGIQTGLVIARADDGRNGVYELTGDTINTAARLRSLASSGDVLIGDATMEQLHGLVEVEDAGRHEVRGKAQPIAAHRVLRSLHERSRFDTSREVGFTTFTGREAEMSALADVARTAFAGHGQVIVVEGEAGAGKSRLCHEFVRHNALVHPDVIVLQGRCQAYGSVTSYLPFVQLVREALGIERGTSVQELHQRVPDAVTRLDADLTGRVPAYLHLLSALTVDQLPADWRGDRLPEVLQRACVDLIGAVASTTRCIVKLDDWHWADPASRLTLTRLVEAVGTMPALVLIAQRPSTVDGEARPRLRIELDALDAAQSRHMVCAHFGVGAVQDELADRIHERTLGNPFFVEEVCASLAASGATEVVDDCLYAVGRPESIAIPATVQAVLLGRIDALPPGPKRTLRAASVIGREFTLSALRRLLPGDDLEGHVRELQDRGLVEPMSVDADGRFRFRHVITQSVTYDSLLVRDRADVHLTIARAIEADQSDDDRLQQKDVEALAHHYLGAAEHGRAIEYLEASGNKAYARFAVAEARSRFGHAIDVSLVDPDDADARNARIRLGVRWAETCVYAPMPEQIELLQRVMGEAIEDGDFRHAALLGYWINWLRHSIGEQAAAEQGTRLMLDQLGETDNPIAEVLESLLGMILTASRQPTDGLEWLRRGVQRRDDAYRSGDIAQAASGMHVYTLAQRAVALADAGAMAEARDAGAYALEVTRSVGQRLTEGSVQICRAIADVLTGNWAEVRATVRDIHQLDPVVISPHVERVAEILDSYASIRLGTTHGVERLERAVAAQRTSEQKLALSLSEALLADALADAARPADARARATASLDRRQHQDVFGEDLAEATLLRISALAGAELDGRVEELLQSPPINSSARSEAMVRLAAAQAYRAAGDIDQAEHHVDAAIASMDQMGLTGWLTLAVSLRESLGS
jgi:class 3 adenylate cyclase